MQVHKYNGWDFHHILETLTIGLIEVYYIQLKFFHRLWEALDEALSKEETLSITLNGSLLGLNF